MATKGHLLPKSGINSELVSSQRVKTGARSFGLFIPVKFASQHSDFYLLKISLQTLFSVVQITEHKTCLTRTSLSEKG